MLNKKVEYEVTEGHNLNKLKENVDRFIKQGFEPIGGVCFAKGNYAQAMLKQFPISETIISL